MKMMKGKTAIITGGTQGLGEGIARGLIAVGLNNLVICGRNKSNGERLSDEFNQMGCKTVYLRADLAEVSGCDSVVKAAIVNFGKIDYLVNSAATTERGFLLNTNQDLFDRMFAINVRAPFFLMQGVIENMLANNAHGSIVNICSMSAHGGQPFLAAYSASKAALVNLTLNTAAAHMRDGIRVNGINLGWTNTPGEHAIQHSYHKSPDDWLEKAEAWQPFGRLIKPDEIARFVAFLLSEESGMLTGQVIDYDQSVMGTHWTVPERPQKVKVTSKNS